VQVGDHHRVADMSRRIFAANRTRSIAFAALQIGDDPAEKELDLLRCARTRANAFFKSSSDSFFCI
jgi:hypothetical protein